MIPPVLNGNKNKKMKTLKTLKILLLFFPLISTLSCGGWHKYRKDWEKQTEINPIVTEQFENCKGQFRYAGVSRTKECKYEEIHCLSNGKGFYLLLGVNPINDDIIDTIVYLDFIPNPKFKKFKNYKKRFDDKLGVQKIEAYPYIANGKAFFNFEHIDRARLGWEHPVYIKADTVKVEVMSDRIYGFTTWGYIENWGDGRISGTYQEGLKEGEWTYINASWNEDKLQVKSKEISTYRKGLKEGISKVYDYDAVRYDANIWNVDSILWYDKPMGIYTYKNGAHVK